MYSYFAQFIPQDDGKICVYFPDIDVATFGDNMEDAVFMAQDALRTYIEVCLEEKDPIPKASNVQAAKEKAENHCKELDISISNDTTYQFIQAEVAQKPLRVNITFAPKILKSIDKAAKVHGLSRSAFLTVAAQDYIHRNV